MREKTHEVCGRCKKDCKKEYTFWSGMMPDWVYCDVSTEGEEEEEKPLTEPKS